MLREYAREHGLNVVDEYIDDGWSGTKFDRPDFQRMIDNIKDGKINCVVTKDLSRLGRNYILTGQYTEIYFPSKGVRYIAINDNVDTIHGESELVPFLNILNEMHARQTSKKVKAAMHTRFANGAHYGARPSVTSKTRTKSGICWWMRKQSGLLKRYLTLPFMVRERLKSQGFSLRSVYPLRHGAIFRETAPLPIYLREQRNSSSICGRLHR